jgi:hypothetical protein
VVASASLGSIIAGAFALLHDWSSRDQQRCALATQFLGDETPSPALSVSNRQRLAAEAHSRLLRCLGDGLMAEFGILLIFLGVTGLTYSVLSLRHSNPHSS